MAYETIGRATGLTVATPSVTVSGAVITDWDFELSDEIIEYLAGNSRHVHTFVGKITDTLSFKTSDFSIFTALKQGKNVTTVALEIEAPILDSDGDLQHAKTLTVSFSDAKIVEGSKANGTNDGKPSEYTVKFQAHKNPSTNADPTITVTLA